MFIKVRNCCSNPFIAANVTHAAAMDLERLRAGGDVHAGVQQQCGCSCTSFGLSLGKERLQGRTQAGGESGLNQAPLSAAIPKMLFEVVWQQLLPMGIGVCDTRSGVGVGSEPPLNGTVQREEGIFILPAPRAAGSSGQGGAFLWQRQMDEAVPSDIPASASALRCDKSILGGARASPGAG